MKFTKLLLTIAATFLTIPIISAQQYQSQSAPLTSTNTRYSNGVTPGYAPCANQNLNCPTTTGLNLHISPGTSFGFNTLHEYSGGTLLLSNGTNYVYLDTSSNFTPTSNTSGFTSIAYPLAVVVASGGTIISVDDVRTYITLPSPGPAGTPTGSYQFSNGTGLSGNPYILDASASPGADAGAKIQACLNTASSLGGTACTSATLGLTQTSANNITIPSYTTLLINGTLTFANGKGLIQNVYSRLVGTGIFTAMIVGNINGAVVDATVGSTFMDGINVTNNDTTDASATAAHFGLNQNFVGTLLANGGGTNTIQVDPGYYDEFNRVISNPYNAAGNAIYIQGANAIQIHYFHSGAPGQCLAVDNTNGFTFDWIDCENSTSEEMLFGSVVYGPVTGSLNGGYMEPSTGAATVYIGPYMYGGVITSNNVVYWGYNTGCGPSAVSCSGSFLTFGSSTPNVSNITPSFWNGINSDLIATSGLGALMTQGIYGIAGIWATSGTTLAVINNTSGHTAIEVASLKIADEDNLDAGSVVIPNNVRNYHGTAGTNLQFSDGTGTAGVCFFASDGSCTATAGALQNGATATTQSVNDGTAKVATDAYADRAGQPMQTCNASLVPVSLPGGGTTAVCTVTLDTGDLLSLLGDSSNAFDAVQAAGPGTVIMPTSVMSEYLFNTTPFDYSSGFGGTPLGFEFGYYGTGDTGIVYSPFYGVNAQATSNRLFPNTIYTTSDANLSTAENTDLVLWPFINPGGITSGDGSIVLTISYIVVPIT